MQITISILFATLIAVIFATTSGCRDKGEMEKAMERRAEVIQNPWNQ